MKSLREVSVLLAAVLFGALAMISQTLLLRRFLWRFEAAETGVALFLASWLLWAGLGAALAATAPGRRVVSALSRVPWLLLVLCAALYFVQYALIGNLRAWLGVADYQAFPVLHLAAGCFLANAPFCLAAGWVVPALGARLQREGLPVSRAFAWEALGAALGGGALTLWLISGGVPDPRDEAEWSRYFPQAAERPGRFETGAGTTFYGTHGGSFYALSSGGVAEVIPEGDRSVDLAALLLSQRPYAKRVLLLGQVPLSVGLALESLRPDIAVTWCPCDAAYGAHLLQVAGARTSVSAACESPQRFLQHAEIGAFDAVMAAPPSGCSLAGAVWRCEPFLRDVRRVAARTGVVLYGLACETVTLTPEKNALVAASVRSLRSVWPESGCFAAGAGGWWIAAQVPRLAYGPGDAPGRFALLKRESVYPASAVGRLYDADLASRLSQQCAVLDPATDVLEPDDTSPDAVLALALADSLRAEYPTATPAAWFENVTRVDGIRLCAWLLVALWLLPVAAGSREKASRRLLAAWFGACGALGLAASLAVLYRLQMRFGMLYLLAGAASWLYLGGLYAGNRAGESVARLWRDRPLLRRLVLLPVSLVLAGAAAAALAGSARVDSPFSVVAFCFVLGAAGGLAVPFAFAAAEGGDAPDAARFVFADALGAAVAGLSVVALVPLAGLWGGVICFALLVCGLGLCVAVCGEHARLSAALALVVTVALLGGRVREMWPSRGWVAGLDADALSSSVSPAAPKSEQPRGVPRKFDAARVRELMDHGKLSTNAASYWE